MSVQNTKIVTPIGRASFPSVFTPKAFGNQDPKYSLTLLLPKGDPEVEKWIAETKKLCGELAKEKWGANIPKKLHNPFRDGDEEDYDGYAGMWFIRASNDAKRRPQVVRKLRNGTFEPLLEEDFYAGCYAIMSIVPYAFDRDEKKGVTFSLQNVLKVRDGEPFGAGASKPADDFAAAPATDEGGAESGEEPSFF